MKPLLIALLLLRGPAPAQDAVRARPDVRQALDLIRQHQAADIEKQVELAQIPAPGFHEEVRAAALVKEFRRIGLADIEIDPIGNVLGWHRDSSPRTLVVAAHLDTVFPAGTDVTVKRSGSRLLGPGIYDDTRGLTALLSIAEAVRKANVSTRRSILFVCDVGEEGLGSLRGIRYLFHEGRYRERLDAFISIDGDDGSRIVSSEMGSRRYRITVKGPGGHSYGNFGRVNPIHALGRIIAKFSTIEVPAEPKTTYNVGVIGGGTSINSIPFEAWADVDMRSSDEHEIDKMEQKLLQFAREGVAEENRLRAASGTALTLEPKLLAVRKAAHTDPEAPLVRAARWASRQMGLNPQLAVGSTDSNAVENMGLPAVTLTAGGKGGNFHSLDEWFDSTGAWQGVQQVFLTIVAFDSL
jgi:acetylornithine deacetylase/succinyl-diaminopimelate desuccinylase-like protein